MLANDLDEIIGIEREAYPFPWSLRIFHDCLRVGYCCWVAELDSTLEGYAIVSVGGGESHLLNLCIRERSRRCGLARHLLWYLFNLASEHGADTMMLEVRSSNQAACQLYRDSGFVEVGVRQRYYPDAEGREDGLILARSLELSVAAFNHSR
ncbi:MAG: ribosomal-protein-alanine N-acetyltransferase [Gammaproteobacteria bacterium]|nr:MAG: ribosomal-protein-alanine N-acetyltransferase [Gammaproteobacteria bacterium]